jgi:putative nucleotidyltransferase with HDIG domain
VLRLESSGGPAPDRLQASAGDTLRKWLLPLQLAGVVGVPVLVLAVLLNVHGLNPEIEIPTEHFYVVTFVAVVALSISVFLAIEALKIQRYKLVLLSVGFMTMGGLFTIHGLATPGVLLPVTEDYTPATISVVGVSAFLSILLPALLFAVAYSPLLDIFERHLPFWPVGGLIVFTISAIFVFGFIALAQSSLISYLPLTSRPLAYGLALLGAGCLGFASIQQLRSPSLSLPLQTGLGFSFAILAVAEGAMILAPAWTLAWWSYHFLMLTAVVIATGAIAIERRNSNSFRTILEAALDLQVRADVEIEQVAEVAALAAAIEAKDRNTRGHTSRVADLTVAIAREMGMPNRRLQMLARAALLHDIGKLETPDRILRKAGPLDDSEWIEMRKHPEIGARILRRLHKFDEEIEVVLSHHERLDGSGYPRGLVGDQIPDGARILAVADTYDSLVSDRPYRAGLPQDQAVQIIRNETRTHLDPVAVETLFALLSARPADDRRRVPRAKAETAVKPRIMPENLTQLALGAIDVSPNPSTRRVRVQRPPMATGCLATA